MWVCGYGLIKSFLQCLRTCHRIHRSCPRLQEVVHVSQNLCTFHRSCARFTRPPLTTFLFNCCGMDGSHWGLLTRLRDIYMCVYDIYIYVYVCVYTYVRVSYILCMYTYTRICISIQQCLRMCVFPFSGTFGAAHDQPRVFTKVGSRTDIEIRTRMVP